MAPLVDLAGDPHAFAEDDYEEVNATYFSDLLGSRSWSALPAGWHNPHSKAAERFVRPELTSQDHQQYALDEGTALGTRKEAIVALASAWENRGLHWDEVTLCPSVSCANLALLCAMKRRGIHRIVFETPAYFATVEQARLLGFEVVRVPSRRSNGFNVSVDVFVALAREREHSAVWLTQPRFGIGTDQSLPRIQALAAALGRKHSIVLDEAGEQRHPSTLCTLDDAECDVVRTRGLVKGIGLNGLRISFILHPRHWRDDLERVLETAGASIDRYSLSSATDLAALPNLLPSLLAVANDQVCSLRRQLEVQLLGGWAVPTPLHNSYIGTVILDLSDLPGGYREQRVALLEECRALAMPIVLRASIGFAFDPSWEGVRMNYFTPAENVVETGRLLNEAWVGVQRRLSQA